MNVTNATAIPTPGTPAYWTAQREAVAMVQTWKNTELAPDDELDLLRKIAAHGFASSMMAAHGADVARWVMILETLRELFGEDNKDVGDNSPGVSADQVETVAEYCCHCTARTHQSQDGICTLCGKDAETPDAPAPQAALCFWDCQPVNTDVQCTLCRDLERHARGAAAEVVLACRTVPPPTAPASRVVDGGR